MYKDAISHFNNPKPGGWQGENVDFLYKMNFNRFINLRYVQLQWKSQYKYIWNTHRNK